MQARLVAIDGSASIDLVKDLTLIGRDEDCDIRFDQKSISKLHCVIAKTDGLLLIRDLGSTNGTRVDGQRVDGLPSCPTTCFPSPTSSTASCSGPISMPTSLIHPDVVVLDRFRARIR